MVRKFGMLLRSIYEIVSGRRYRHAKRVRQNRSNGAKRGWQTRRLKESRTEFESITDHGNGIEGAPV